MGIRQTFLMNFALLSSNAPSVRYLCTMQYDQLIYRVAQPSDLPAVQSIVAGAVRRLAKAGIDQWQQGYPDTEILADDLRLGRGRLLCTDDRAVAYGALVTTGEPTYAVIEGAWLTADEEYLVLHRLCVAEEAVGCGVARRWMERVEQEATASGFRSIRVDTRAENHIMQRLLARLGYQPCGSIRIEGEPFLAFEKLLA